MKEAVPLAEETIGDRELKYPLPEERSASVTTATIGQMGLEDCRNSRQMGPSVSLRNTLRQSAASVSSPSNEGAVPT